MRTVYGSPLTNPAMETAFKECTQLEEYSANPYREADFIIGRRGGKTSMLASNMAIFEAIEGGRERYLSTGEKGFIIIISPTKK